MLDGVILSGGEKIGYEYDEESPDGMARRLKGGRLTTTYRWLSVCKLEAYLDYEHSLYYSFAYHDEGWLERLKITFLRIAQPGWKSHDYLADIVRQERRTRLHKMLNSYGGGLELWCGCDQVGTPKLFTDRHGRVMKELEFDSFGNLRGDSNPDLFIPIGFAGGLADLDTGLVRFGWRDYDACVGRFTALDPARDMRGDGDLYDYCVDDPISHVDPTGLEFSHAAAIAGGESHKGISHPFGAPHSAGGIAYHRAAPRGGVGAGRGGATVNKPAQRPATPSTSVAAAQQTPAHPFSEQDIIKSVNPDGDKDYEPTNNVLNHYSLAKQYAEQNGQSLPLVLALIHEESRGKPQASNAGHFGLMQLGAQAAQEGGLHVSSTELQKELSKPDVNLKTGTAYLQHMQTKAGIVGDDLTIIAHRGGHTLVRKCIREFARAMGYTGNLDFATQVADFTKSLSSAQYAKLVDYVAQKATEQARRTDPKANYQTYLDKVKQRMQEYQTLLDTQKR